MRKLTKLNLLEIAVWLTLLAAFWITKEVRHLSGFELAREMVAHMKQFPSGLLFFVIIYAIRPLVFIPSTFFALLAGALFGFWKGALITFMGDMLSMQVAYGLAYTLGESAMPPRHRGRIALLKERLRENPFSGVALLRLIQLHLDVVSYTAGLLRLPWQPFTVASMVGVMPGEISFVSLGSAVKNFETLDFKTMQIDPWPLAGGILFLTLTIMTALWIRKRKQKVL